MGREVFDAVEMAVVQFLKEQQGHPGEGFRVTVRSPDLELELRSEFVVGGQVVSSSYFIAAHELFAAEVPQVIVEARVREAVLRMRQEIARKG